MDGFGSDGCLCCAEKIASKVKKEMRDILAQLDPEQSCTHINNFTEKREFLKSK